MNESIAMPRLPNTYDGLSPELDSRLPVAFNIVRGQDVCYGFKGGRRTRIPLESAVLTHSIWSQLGLNCLP